MTHFERRSTARPYRQLLFSDCVPNSMLVPSRAILPHYNVALLPQSMKNLPPYSRLDEIISVLMYDPCTSFCHFFLLMQLFLCPVIQVVKVQLIIKTIKWDLPQMLWMDIGQVRPSAVQVNNSSYSTCLYARLKLSDQVVGSVLGLWRGIKSRFLTVIFGRNISDRRHFYIESRLRLIHTQIYSEPGCLEFVCQFGLGRVKKKHV